MQAKGILAKDYRPREAVFAVRNRCDETVDLFAQSERSVSNISVIFFPNARTCNLPLTKKINPFSLHYETGIKKEN